MKQIDFGKGSVTGCILRSALPMLAAQFINLLYNIVDRIYIGRIQGVGTAALGGVGLCFPVISIILAFTNMFGSGGAPLCAIERGRGDTEKAGRIMDTSGVCLFWCALALMLIGEIFCAPILRLFGASDTSIQYALPYMRIYLLGTIFSMLATGLNPFINAQGFPGTGMTSVLIGAVANIVLDPVFIFMFGLGVSGAAIATVISQGLSALFVLRFLTGRKPELHLHFLHGAQLRAALPLAGAIVGLGTAAFVQQVTNSLVQIACNSVLSHIGGDIYVSVMAILTSIRQMFEIPVLAIGEGSSPVISYNYGARSAGRTRKAIFATCVMGILYTLLVWLLILWKPEMFISIFTSDRTILSDAVPALHLYLFAFIFMALQYTGQTTFKSLNKKKHAIFFSIFRKIIIVVPLTYLLPTVFGFGTDGVFMAEPVSNVIGGTACFVTMLLTVMPELRRMEKAAS